MKHLFLFICFSSISLSLFSMNCGYYQQSRIRHFRSYQQPLPTQTLYSHVGFPIISPHHHPPTRPQNSITFHLLTPTRAISATIPSWKKEQSNETINYISQIAFPDVGNEPRAITLYKNAQSQGPKEKIAALDVMILDMTRNNPILETYLSAFFDDQENTLSFNHIPKDPSSLPEIPDNIMLRKKDILSDLLLLIDADSFNELLDALKDLATNFTMQKVPFFLADLLNQKINLFGHPELHTKTLLDVALERECFNAAFILIAYGAETYNEEIRK